MINLHESMRPGWDRTRDPWIYSQTRICSQTRYRLHYAAQSRSLCEKKRLELAICTPCCCERHFIMLPKLCKLLVVYQYYYMALYLTPTQRHTIKENKWRGFVNFVIVIMLPPKHTFKCLQYIHNRYRLTEDVHMQQYRD